MSQVSSNVTFFCSHCYAKFQAPLHLQRARVFCQQCKAVTFVTLRQKPAGSHAPDLLQQKLNSAISDWVRTSCRCGKTIKAPAALAGTVGSCPRCGTSIQIPSGDSHLPSQPKPAMIPERDFLASNENSTVIAPDSQPADGFDFREIKYDPLTIKKVDPASRFDGFVRAQCPCGFRVKAPAEQGGKSGKCPKCGQPIIMPLPPVFKLVSALDAMAISDDLEQIDDDDQNQKSAVIALGSALADDLNESLQINAPQEQPAVDQGPSVELKGLAGDTPTSRRIFAFKLQLRAWRRKFDERIWKNPLLTLVISTLTLAIGVTGLVWQYLYVWRSQPIEIPWKSQPVQITFYDAQTGNLFKAPSNTASPTPGLAAQSDKQLASDPANQAFRAYRFACSGCDAKEPTFVGLIEKFDPAANQAWQHHMESNRIPQIPSLYDATLAGLAGRYISRPNPIHWVNAASPEGLELKKSVETQSCPDQKVAQYCRE